MMTKTQSTTLALSLLLLGQLACAVPAARAGDLTLENTADTSKGGTTDDASYGRRRFTLAFDSRFGYDDNTLGQPDTARILSGFNAVTGAPIYKDVNVDSSSSAFLNFALSGSYTAASPRLTLTLGADVGVNYYFDRPGRDYDVNGGLSARVTYRATPRLLLEGSSYNAYESQGDYGATNLTNFTGQFNGGTRTPGTSAERNGDYFYTTNYLAATYQFTPRISTVLSDTFVAFAYDDEPYITDQDRIENYTQLEGRYLVQPELSLAVDYRFGYIDYFGVDNDSDTHFLLAGLDYTFNTRLRGGFRAGVEFRHYFDTVGDETSPYLEGNLTYDLSKNAHLSYVVHYGIEEGDLSADNSKSDALRTGIDYEQNFTARLSGYLGFYYTHAFYETPIGNDPTLIVYDTNGGFNEDTFDVALGARYAFNRHLSAEIGYTHTSVVSDVDVRSYDRNRVFAGVRLSY